MYGETIDHTKYSAHTVKNNRLFNLQLVTGVSMQFYFPEC